MCWQQQLLIVHNIKSKTWEPAFIISKGKKPWSCKIKGSINIYYRNRKHLIPSKIDKSQNDIVNF